MPFRNHQTRMRLYLLAAVIGIAFGMHGHYRASLKEWVIARKDDTLHSQAATIVGQRETNAILRMAVWQGGVKADSAAIAAYYNSLRIDSLETAIHEKPSTPKLK